MALELVARDVALPWMPQRANVLPRRSREVSDDKRFTNGLIFDVVTALEKHGYKNTDVRAMGQFVGDLLKLTQTFESAPSSASSANGDLK